MRRVPSKEQGGFESMKTTESNSSEGRNDEHYKEQHLGRRKRMKTTQSITTRRMRTNLKENPLNGNDCGRRQSRFSASQKVSFGESGEVGGRERRSCCHRGQPAYRGGSFGDTTSHYPLGVSPCRRPQPRGTAGDLAASGMNACR